MKTDDPSAKSVFKMLLISPRVFYSFPASCAALGVTEKSGLSSAQKDKKTRCSTWKND